MLPLVRSTYYREEETTEQLTRFLRTAKQLSFGPRCVQFEEQFAQYQGRSQAVFVNSGSSANLALLQALLNLGRLQRGDAVGFSALTWSTNVMPLLQLGLRVVPIDIELDTLNVSSAKLAAVLAKTPLRAVFLTNVLGFCDDIDAIRDRCANDDIMLLEDTCESLGTVYRGVKLGNFGLASTFSFYVGHHLSTIEGGMVCTDDEQLATMLRIVRAHGWDRNLSAVHQGEIRLQHELNSAFDSRYTFYDLGFNLRPTEIAGFLGTVQLQYLDEIIQKRVENFLALAPAIYEHSDRYVPIRYDHIDVVSNFAVPIVCRSRADRDALVATCANRVEIRPIVGGSIPLQPFFRKYAAEIAQAFPCPQAGVVNDQALYFGNHPELSATDRAFIVSIFAREHIAAPVTSAAKALPA